MSLNIISIVFIVSMNVILIAALLHESGDRRIIGDDDEWSLECIQLRIGRICGTKKMVAGREVTAFFSVPYAQPPVGKLRFRPPAPVNSWFLPRDATKLSPSCPQFRTANSPFEEWPSDTVIQEDCLYLNIWSPASTHQVSDRLRAVMVWFHGGGFNTGSSSLFAYHGQSLAAHSNVLVVGVNYRLGFLGFSYLGSETADMPGNLGLLDQQLALKWIQNHIHRFGGNPENVTIYGQNAGGASVTAHLVAPGSQSLFRGAIAQSGSILNGWALLSKRKALQNTLNVIKVLGCLNADIPNSLDESYEIRSDYRYILTSLNHQRIIQCCRTQSIDDILLATSSLMNSASIQTLLAPVDDDELFFHHRVQHLLKTTNFSSKSLIMGFNANEASLFLAVDYPNSFPFNRPWNMTRDVYAIYGYTKLGSYYDSLRKAVLWQYDDNALGSYMNRLDELLSDKEFNCGIRQTAVLVSKTCPRVYVYYYNHTFQTSNGLGVQQWGAFHGSELGFVFGKPLLQHKQPMKEEYTYTTEELLLGKEIMRLWSKFAQSGEIPEWPALTDTATVPYRILRTGKQFILQNLKGKQCSFWNEIEQLQAEANHMPRRNLMLEQLYDDSL